MRVKPTLVTVVFLILLAVIANLAWATAVGTTGPWFQPTVLAPFFSATLLTAGILALGLAALAARRVAALDASLEELDGRIAGLRASSGMPVNPGPAAALPAMPAVPSVEADLEEILQDLELQDAGEAGSPARDAHDSLMADDGGAEADARVQLSLLKILRARRIALAQARGQVVRSVAGPIAFALLFASVAGILLP